MTKIRLYDLANSTTLESNKSPLYYRAGFLWVLESSKAPNAGCALLDCRQRSRQPRRR